MLKQILGSCRDSEFMVVMRVKARPMPLAPASGVVAANHLIEKTCDNASSPVNVALPWNAGCPGELLPATAIFSSFRKG
jgi:hypothetical protein